MARVQRRPPNERKRRRRLLSAVFGDCSKPFFFHTFVFSDVLLAGVHAGVRLGDDFCEHRFLVRFTVIASRHGVIEIAAATTGRRATTTSRTERLRLRAILPRDSPPSPSSTGPSKIQTKTPAGGRGWSKGKATR